MTKDALLEAFKIFDKDGDGALNRDELSRALGGDMSDTDLDMIIADFDANGDGVLQYEEMATAWAALGLRVPSVAPSLEEKADRIMAALDADGSGTISVQVSLCR